MNDIQISDPKLQTTIAVIRNDNNSTDMKNNFKARAIFLLPSDPVTKI